MKQSVLADIRARIWDLIHLVEGAVSKDGTDDAEVIAAYEHLQEASTHINAVL